VCVRAVTAGRSLRQDDGFRDEGSGNDFETTLIIHAQVRAVGLLISESPWVDLGVQVS
jgi:hypothetical protein